MATDRWNVNLPAVVGVVLVFLIGVSAWVIVGDGSDDDDPAAVPGTPPTTPTETTSPATGSTGTTTPAPMPDLAPANTAAPTVASSAPPSTPPVTASPDAEPGAVPGDLGIAGRPMLAPPCIDSFITIIASAVGDDATSSGIESVLDEFPDSNYLRTDQTCPSLTQDVDGEPVYVVYLGPFPFASDACTARADGTPDAYARQLSEDLSPDHSIDCDG